MDRFFVLIFRQNLAHSLRSKHLKKNETEKIFNCKKKNLANECYDIIGCGVKFGNTKIGKVLPNSEQIQRKMGYFLKWSNAIK